MISNVQASFQKHFYVFTPIKLNLALHVVGQRSDGYHLIESLVYFSLSGDCLHYAPCESDQFILTGQFAKGLVSHSDNLVIRARDFMHKNFPESARPAFFRLIKILPVASGIGGGSGDAAGVVSILRRHWKLDCPYEKLAKMSLVLGADVPMCLFALEYRQPLLVKGIGQEIIRLKEACSLAMVLVNHGQEISTQAVFKALDKRHHSSLKVNPVALKSVDSLVEALKETRNDLFSPALKIAPQLAKVLFILDECGSLFSRMSGTGATCFGIFKNQQAAQRAALLIKSMYPNWFVKPIMTLGTI
ncbi:4-(cytidine 5'-diphospho)-2-C-methyl-D-erythritol kinase [Bartonella rattimassiliensis]|uniref:4-diphosphocytidyl-2-C-methyl-D-erythritol kinase n=1 Tax=Bartonella rattimassiliensis 15908 TaxID=1094556 RepID=J0QUC2_9HYPH|nr:4-(cytidine 5'-diphospho)-2-C-methyl-D-erythritol kinase [Bartonella rattimassiliensis]EJF86734.1 4-diphosphocytidyl-2-C-methyl-D-erythritol kinase [Bartonella rattimassiliensis 15908]